MNKLLLKIFLVNILLIEIVNADKVWIFFQDKGMDDGQTINLSDKSLLRRQKVGLGYTNYDQKISSNYLESILKTGVTVVHKSRWLNAISVFGNEDQLDIIRQFSFVKTVRPVARFINNREEFKTPSSSRERMTADSSFYGYAWGQLEQINCQTAHDAGFAGQGIRILILDTGFNTNHVAFDSLMIIDQWDFVNNDGQTANETADEDAFGQHNHGTMVFSAMAGYDPGNLVSPAYRAEFLLAKTENVATETIIEEDNYVAALEWGEANGADIASSSLGYLDWYSYCDMDGNTAVTTQAVDIAVSLGMVCVTAAGNWGTTSPPPNPCDTLYYYISAPADADSVISVGAVNQDGNIASFSSHGPTYDGRIKPEVCAQGVSTWCVNPNSTTAYRTASGTSLSTPLVGGAVAVILSAHPDWTPMELRGALIETSDRFDTPDNRYGYGIIDVMAVIDYETVSVVEENIPDQYSILNVYPNPFNPSTSFQINLMNPASVKLEIFDISGRSVETLVKRAYYSGEFKIEWNASENPSGLYFVNMTVGEHRITRKISLIK